MTGDVQVVIEFRRIISHDARVICPPKKIKWSFQKLTRTSLRNVSYKYFHQRNLYKIKTSKNPDPCYGCVLVTVFIGCVNRGCIGGACLSSIGDLPCVRPSDGVYGCMS